MGATVEEGLSAPHAITSHDSVTGVERARVSRTLSRSGCGKPGIATHGALEESGSVLEPLQSAGSGQAIAQLWQCSNRLTRRSRCAGR
jgi:hypothetical protein